MKTYRGKVCTESRAFSDATGTGTEWRFPDDSATGGQWPVGKQWCEREHVALVMSPALRAAVDEPREKSERAASDRAASEAIKAAAKKVASDLEAKVLTFGDAKRDAAMLALAKSQELTAAIVLSDLKTK